jgi:RNA polymerase sigma factor (sigma-70 family)
MPQETGSALSGQLATLFGAGTCAGLTDGDLLERFRTDRDEAGERAFEAIVTRHGPMVLGICRQFLEDPTDAHDAFQAVFLVLARRAGAIRKSESLGSWLYGVTVRVAARARATAIRRRIRDRRVLAAASAAAVAGGSPEAGVVRPAEPDDGPAVVHEEVARLPERYRTPIVLCYFEGLTHDEAAARLSWPVGTVRSRLSRARDRLRGRLTRRGLVAPSTIGPLAAWLIASHSPATASAAIRAATAAAPLPVHVPASLARAAVRVAAGQPAAAGSFSAASQSLADGVLATMMFKKLTVIAAVVVTFGIGTGSSFLMIGRSQAQVPPPATAAATDQPKPVGKPQFGTSKAVDPLVQRLLDAARQRVEAQKVYYEEGRITIDRFLDALTQLEKAELRAAADGRERLAARQKYANIVAEIVQREQAELQVGRGTASDVAEAQQCLNEALLELSAARSDFDLYDAAALKLVAAARQRYEAQEAYYKEGRITLDRFADASRALAEAELRAAKTDYERIAVKKRNLDRLKAIEEREEAEVKAGRGTKADLAEASMWRVEAELDLHEAMANKGATDLAPILRRLSELERKVEQLQKERDGRK